MQRLDGALPVLPVNQVVEIGDDVIDRTALNAERDPAVHAACGLDLRVFVGQAQVKLAVVPLARLRRLVRLLEALVFQESGDLAHDARNPDYAARRLCLAASSPSARRYSFGNT